MFLKTFFFFFEEYLYRYPAKILYDFEELAEKCHYLFMPLIILFI